MEVVAGIHQLRLPLTDNPLQYINVYLVQGKDGWLLVDTGWDTPEALYSLERQLKEIGLGFADINQIVVTHTHFDHYGLAGRLKQLSGARLELHQMEKSFIQKAHVNIESLLLEIAQWLRINGVPEADLDELQSPPLMAKESVLPPLPDITLQGGESISTGIFHFQVLWTPGHSPGHISLYEPERKILICGDHILPVTTPNISFGVQSSANPLGEYLDSLRKIQQLEVELILPGHEHIFHDLRGRVDELLQHHHERIGAIAEVIRGEPETAYQISTQLIWMSESGGVTWSELASLDRRMAVTETLAHLELLRIEGRAEKFPRDGTVFYSTPGSLGDDCQ